MLLGEIRDHETAQISIEAALTGHLVLSTLHTNDAPSAVTRLTEMDVEPFLVGSALDAVLAQRLARKLCASAPRSTPRSGRSCAPSVSACATTSRCRRCAVRSAAPPCSKTGYKGRLALHEVMLVSEEIERLTVARASATEIAAVAREQGMVTLREDGMAKVRAGRHHHRRDPSGGRVSRALKAGPAASDASRRPGAPVPAPTTTRDDT